MWIYKYPPFLSVDVFVLVFSLVGKAIDVPNFWMQFFCFFLVHLSSCIHFSLFIPILVLLSLDKTEEKGKNFKIDFLFLFSRSKHVLGILHLRN